MKEKIVLQRHGESVANVRKIFASSIIDMELTPNGITQAKNACANYNGFDIKTIVTSPLKRALQTAEIIADYLKVNLEIDENLIEVNVGILEGKDETNKENRFKFDETIDLWLTGYNASFISGECKNDVIYRIDNVHKKWTKEFKGSVCLVSHCVFLSMFIWYLTKETDRKKLFLKKGETRFFDYKKLKSRR